MKRPLCFAAAAIMALMILAPLSPAQADVAPPPVPNGTNITPGEEQTQVRMVSEKVVIAVATQSQNDAGQATVTASFQMRNLGSTAEQMQVRFPLCSGYDGQDNIGCATYPPIEDFGVRVDGVPQKVENTYGEHSSIDDSTMKVPTWANFSVTFPPGKDVNILVRYTQLGYDCSGPGYSEYSYILATGAGWNGTIGTADIIFRLPMAVSEETVYYYHPNAGDLQELNQAGLADNEIRIHLEDFEPGNPAPSSISATVLQPKVWEKIQTESKNVAVRPNDGEAWGRLGKAYKTAVLLEKGHIRQGKVGEAWYWKSVDAYQKAVDLLPKDADWHYGFADLLASNLFFNNYVRNGEDKQALQVQTVQQLKQALDINPKHAGALELLREVGYNGIVDLNGDKPIYLILTATPTRTTAPSDTPTKVIPTRTRQLTATISPTLTATPAPTDTPTPHATIAAAQTTATPAPGRANVPGVCGSAMIPALVGAIVLVKKAYALG